MNKKLDEVYMTLLKAKQSVYEYTNNKVKNENWRPYYNSIVEELDNIIADYAITTKMSCDEILDCLFEMGADDEKSIFHDTYKSIKFNL